ncbi:MAG: hypothetical protein HY820_15310 [Acidobacteria bacterium]|nr:hypothetical protein [Acidobacteriota bacterium]
MRTTLTLDPDVALKLREHVAQSKRPFKEVVNRALRAGLAGAAAPPPKRFRVKAHALGLKPGIDPDKLNQLVDEIEAEEYARHHS